MVGAAIRAGPGALGGAGGWAGAAATFVACVIPLLPCEAEVDPRSWEQTLPFPDVFRLPLPWCLRLEPRRRQRRIFFFPSLEYRAVSDMCGELGIEKGEDIHEEGRTPSEALFSRPAITAAAAILYTRLTAGVFSKEGCPQGQVGVDHVICHGANNRVVLVIEGPEAVIYREGVLAGMCI